MNVGKRIFVSEPVGSGITMNDVTVKKRNNDTKLKGQSGVIHGKKYLLA